MPDGQQVPYGQRPACLMVRKGEKNEITARPTGKWAGVCMHFLCNLCNFYARIMQIMHKLCKNYASYVTFTQKLCINNAYYAQIMHKLCTLCINYALIMHVMQNYAKITQKLRKNYAKKITQKLRIRV